MTCTTQIHMTRTFSRTNVNAPKGHPMRGQLRAVPSQADNNLVSAIKREHLLRQDDDAPRRKIIVIRDTVISIMGAVSAMVPILIAIQSAVGA